MTENRQIFKNSDGGLVQQFFETTASQVIEETDKRFLTDSERTKLVGIEGNAQVNKIETISLNGTAQTITNKNVNLVVSVTAGTQLSYNTTTGVIQLLDKDNTVLSSVDLPLELLIQSGSYNSTTKKIELVLANGDKIEIDAQDLVDEYLADGTTLTLDTTSGNVFKLSTTYKNKIDNTETKANANEAEITKIKNGTTKVVNATNADKLSAQKTITVSGDVTGSVSTDFSNNVALSLSLPNKGTAGVYSVVQTDTKGRITAGSSLIEFGTASQNTPTDNLAVGGLFFKLV